MVLCDKPATIAMSSACDSLNS